MNPHTGVGQTGAAQLEGLPSQTAIVRLEHATRCGSQDCKRAVGINCYPDADRQAPLRLNRNAGIETGVKAGARESGLERYRAVISFDPDSAENCIARSSIARIEGAV